MPTDDSEGRLLTMNLALVLAAAIAAGLATGCSGGGAQAAPVDPTRAREALTSTLEHWKKGDSIEALKNGSPAIVAQDFDWMAGNALVAYEVGSNVREDNANLRIPVELTMRSRQGKELRKSVTYLVGTSPSLTVFRDFP